MSAVCCDGIDAMALAAHQPRDRHPQAPAARAWDHPIGRAILRRHRWLQLRGRWMDLALARAPRS